MKIFYNFNGKLIKMNSEYPIYDRENEDVVIGYTSIGDMAVITYADSSGDGYFETVIVSGEYIGVDTLALNLEDIMGSTFIFNKIDDVEEIYFGERKVDSEIHPIK